MLDKQKLGLEIKKLRKAKKLTQHQLAEGMCSQSEISRIEAGEFFPSLDLLYLIANQLQIPINYFFEILAHEQAEEIKAIKNKVWALSSSKNHKELFHYTEELLLQEIAQHPETKKFLLWHNYTAAYYLGRLDANNCRTELLLLIRKKMLGTDNLLDLHIKNTIANLYAENNHFKESGELYQSILNEKLDTTEANNLKIKVIYNFGKLLYLKKDYTSSLHYTDQGIRLSVEGANMSLLGQFYYQKGALLEKLDFSAAEISASYQKAQFFFEMLDLEVYTNILLENKSHYLLGSTTN
ncbi:helix-turn-helix transcriptional regulator (plasmid) [Planococcus glaciei]|uniref:Helix-turn-helix transcriptional regulator n=1 Tax=Planococcus glaciei TaxID=459472 RepID=A0A7H8QFY5_9BACL|nr:helix-turn-helix domain-containing protein [Planococcus glaciei]QDY46992.1 helix-turn-helix transcriptional regulator [Planococcus glaciei]QKX52870.1 helix-turn-helix transcriptional regulator [Planococcus glaciei]